MSSIKILKKKPFLFFSIVFIVIPLAALSIYLYLFVHASTGNLSGQLTNPLISAPARIQRDEHGVTYITAENDFDAYFAVGFAHAQDRLWQLELQKRMSSGALAEIFGKEAVGFDIYSRTLGLYGSAESSMDSLSQEAKQSLQAYTAGINSWINTTENLPLEFVILDITPSQWRPQDTLAWIKMFSLSLSGHYQKDLNRYLIRQTFDTDKQQALLEPVNGNAAERQAAVGKLSDESVSLPDASSFNLSAAIAQLVSDSMRLEQQWGLGGENVGSNAWVVAASHSASGRAVLANDPHLGIEVPSQWYALSINTGNRQVKGMSLVGLPIVMLGMNNHIAWGTTNMLADTMDVYFEDVNTRNNALYRRGDDWKTFDTTVEKIDIKADFPAFLREPLEPIEVKVRRTDHGPVISDIIGNSAHTLSLKWLGDESNDTTYEAFFDLNYATSWEEFNTALAQHISPAMNMLYMDAKDNIGFLGIGKIPLRVKGNGSLPQPGWEQEYDWHGYIPFEEMPQQYNPGQGFIVSANNRNVDNDYPYFISEDWAAPQRAMRIEQLLRSELAAGGKIATDAHREFQTDVKDLNVPSVVSLITDLEFDEDDASLDKLLEPLRDWDGTADKDDIAPTIFFTWMRHLREEIYGDEFSPYWGNTVASRRQREIVKNLPLHNIVSALGSNEIDWCDQQDTEERETCEELLIYALKLTRYELYKLYGGDISDWQWGKALQVKFAHRPFSNVKGLDVLFDRTADKGGSPDSVNMADFKFVPGEGYIQTVGAAFRQIIQFGPQQPDLLFMSSMGQSGNVASEHYDDMMEPFENGDLYSFPDTPSTVNSQFTLLPNNHSAEGDH